MRSGGTQSRGERHVSCGSYGLTGANGLAEGTADYATAAPQGTALAFLGHLQANRPERLRSGVIFLATTGPRFGRLPGRTLGFPIGVTPALRWWSPTAVGIVWRFGTVGEGILELFGGYARLLEGAASTAV
jgi:hypothetical protein